MQGFLIVLRIFWSVLIEWCLYIKRPHLSAPWLKTALGLRIALHTLHKTARGPARHASIARLRRAAMQGFRLADRGFARGRAKTSVEDSYFGEEEVAAGDAW